MIIYHYLKLRSFGILNFHMYC